MSMLVSDETLRPCPFDPHHKVSERRFKCHLLSCVAKRSGEFDTCEYNAAHFVPTGDLPKHYESCPDLMAAIQHLKMMVLGKEGKLVRETVKEMANTPRPVQQHPQVTKPLVSFGDDDDENRAWAITRTVVHPNFNVLTPFDWNRLKRLETFEPLTKFQVQTMTKGERKRYHQLLIRWQKWKNARRMNSINIDGQQW